MSQCASVPSASPSSTELPQELSATARKSGRKGGYGTRRACNKLRIKDYEVWGGQRIASNTCRSNTRLTHGATHIRPKTTHPHLPGPATRGVEAVYQRCAARECPAGLQGNSPYRCRLARTVGGAADRRPFG